MIAEITNSDLGTWLYAAATVAQLAGTVTLLITINSKQRREVSFAGEPLDRKEFDKHLTENAAIHGQLFAKIGGAERGIESRMTARMDNIDTESKESRQLMHQEISAIGNDVAALKKEAELANQRAFQLDSKLDRLIERKQHI
ncbi:MAG TPA: hypothetical protein VH619_08870 [Verrucomicrobiae bacterium]|jgi:hypothetical protein|nr:hypothetical protein [Verrucomicrobiae bacterium]